jgi:hypothetical protein
MAYNTACTRQVGFAAIYEYFPGFRFILLSSVISFGPLAGNANRQGPKGLRQRSCRCVALESALPRTMHPAKSVLARWVVCQGEERQEKRDQVLRALPARRYQRRHGRRLVLDNPHRAW